jgi:hypothetical protein
VSFTPPLMVGLVSQFQRRASGNPVQPTPEGCLSPDRVALTDKDEERGLESVFNIGRRAQKPAANLKDHETVAFQNGAERGVVLMRTKLLDEFLVRASTQRLGGHALFQMTQKGSEIRRGHKEPRRECTMALLGNSPCGREEVAIYFPRRRIRAVRTGKSCRKRLTMVASTLPGDAAEIGSRAARGEKCQTPASKLSVSCYLKSVPVRNRLQIAKVGLPRPFVLMSDNAR